MAELAGESRDSGARSSQDAPGHGSGTVPERVRKALETAKDFGEFREKRAFAFLHLFSGQNDVLGKAIYKAAVQEGLTVEISAVDVKLAGGDLPERCQDDGLAGA